MSFKIKARVTKELFHKDDYYILSCCPVESNRDIKLNNYGNFTIIGSLGYLTVDNEYELELEEGKATKYGINYTVKSVPSIAKKELDSLAYEEKFSIMKQATSSDTIATNVLEAYPNFIYDVVMKSDEELDNIIDLKNIKGVGDKYFKAYKRILRDKFMYFSYINRDEVKPYDIGIDDARMIFNKWSNPEESIKALKENPYEVLIGVCGHSFSKADILLKKVRNDLIDSSQRYEAGIIDVLRRNEEDGNSRLNGNECFHYSCYDQYWACVKRDEGNKVAALYGLIESKDKNLFKEEKSNENMSADSINARYAYRESPSNEKLARIIGGLLNAKKNKGL